MIKLLPPKPPKSVGAEKTIEKKNKEDKSAGSKLSESSPEQKGKESDAGNNSEVFNGIDQDKQDASSKELVPDMPPDAPESQLDAGELTDESLPPEVPNEQELEQEPVKLNDSNSESTEKKKKGFFSKMFRKKENKEKANNELAEIKPEQKDEVLDEIQKFDDADTTLDELSDSLEKSIVESGAAEKIFPADENMAPITIQEKQPIESKYVPGKSWSEDVEKLPEIKSPAYSNNALDKISDYVSSPKKEAPAKKAKSKKENVKESKSKSEYEVVLKDNWASESDSEQTVSSPKQAKKGKHLKQDAKHETHKETSMPDKKSEELSVSEEKTETKKKASEEIDFSTPINDWREKSLSASKTKEKPDSKAIKQIDVKLRKLMKTYEQKLLKIASDKKKSILTDIGRLNKKLAEVEKKEKLSLSKEMKLKDSEKSLVERKKELDILVSQEKELTTRKENLQKSIAEHRKVMLDLKNELESSKKSFESQKKSISSETKNMQDNLKSYSLAFEIEKRKGDKKLAELAKKVSETQVHLDEMMKKSRIVAAQLKAKETALHEREKEVLELISQEKKVLSVLKGNEIQNMSHEDLKHKHKSRAKKPATIIGFSGEPELYMDDEDNLNQKINDCKELIHESNYDDAKLLYNEIREEFMSANIGEDAKKIIRHEIRELYDEISLKLIAPN